MSDGIAMRQGQKEYLGDGVYAVYRQHELRLLTSDGMRVTNEIALEPEVWTALLHFMEGPVDHLAEERTE